MLNAAILGASGFVGGELLRLCAAHPRLRPARFFGGTQAGVALADVNPHVAPAYLRFRIELFEPTLLDEVNVVVAALPHGANQARLLVELLDDEGLGTMVKKEASW